MSEVVVRAPEVLWRRTFDRVILLGGEGSELLTLLGTGVDIWDLLSAPQTIESMTAALADRYRAEADVVRSDVAGLIERLASAGVVVGAP